MLEHCHHTSWGAFVAKKVSAKIKKGKTIVMEVDGLFVYEHFFVYLEVKSTLDGKDTKVVHKALKNTHSLATTQLGFSLSVQCQNKAYVGFIGYDFLRGTDHSVEKYMEDKVVRISRNGIEYGYVHYSGDVRKVKSCLPDSDCSGFCELVDTLKKP